MMLRSVTVLNNRALFARLVNPGPLMLNTALHPKKLKPIKDMSTDCDKDLPPVCPPQPCLMDYGPEYIGCWQEVYNERNKKANKDLLLGIVSLILALIVVDRNGMVKGYRIPLFFPNK